MTCSCRRNGCFVPHDECLCGCPKGNPESPAVIAKGRKRRKRLKDGREEAFSRIVKATIENMGPVLADRALTPRKGFVHFTTRNKP